MVGTQALRNVPLVFPPFVATRVSTGKAWQGRSMCHALGSAACAPDPGDPVSLWLRILCVFVSPWRNRRHQDSVGARTVSRTTGPLRTAATPLTRAHAGFPAEDPCEVTLIGEPAAQRD